MQYLKKIEQIKSFDLSQRFVCLLENEKMIINNGIVDFPKCSAFYQIEKQIYSTRDYYLNSENQIHIPEHLTGLFFRGKSFSGIKIYTSNEGSTFLYKDDEQVPLVEFTKNMPGFIIDWNENYYLVKTDLELLTYQYNSIEELSKVQFEDFVDRPCSIFENNLVLFNNKVFIYLHSESWNKYGLFGFDIINGKKIYSNHLFGPRIFCHNEMLYSINGKKNTIQILDLSNYKNELIDLKAELSGYEIETQCKPYFNKNSLFVALKKENEDIYSFWGEIDLRTFKLLFITEMLRDFSKKPTKSNKTFVSEIKANDELVGIRVPGNILHLYERK